MSVLYTVLFQLLGLPTWEFFSENYQPKEVPKVGTELCDKTFPHKIVPSHFILFITSSLLAIFFTLIDN